MIENQAAIFCNAEITWADEGEVTATGVIDVARMPNRNRITMELHDAFYHYCAWLERTEQGDFLGRWTYQNADYKEDNVISGRMTPTKHGWKFVGKWWEADDADSCCDWNFTLKRALGKRTKKKPSVKAKKKSSK